MDLIRMNLKEFGEEQELIRLALAGAKTKEDLAKVSRYARAMAAASVAYKMGINAVNAFSKDPILPSTLTSTVERFSKRFDELARKSSLGTLGTMGHSIPGPDAIDDYARALLRDADIHALALQGARSVEELEFVRGFAERNFARAVTFRKAVRYSANSFGVRVPSASINLMDRACDVSHTLLNEAEKLVALGPTTSGRLSGLGAVPESIRRLMERSKRVGQSFWRDLTQGPIPFVLPVSTAMLMRETAEAYIPERTQKWFNCRFRDIHTFDHGDIVDVIDPATQPKGYRGPDEYMVLVRRTSCCGEPMAVYTPDDPLACEHCRESHGVSVRPRE